MSTEISDSENGSIKVTIFHSGKGMAIMILAIIIGLTIGGSLPFFFNASRSSITFGGILIFAIPFICFPFIKKRCLTQALLLFSETGFEIEELDIGSKTLVNWDDVQNYRLQPFKNFSGVGFVLKIYFKDNSNLKLAIINGDVWNADNKDSLIHIICHNVNKYNESQIDDENKIDLLPSLFASSTGVYLLWLPVIILIFDFIYRLTHRIGFRNDVFFFVFTAIFTLGFFAQRKKDQQFFETVLDIHENG